MGSGAPQMLKSVSTHIPHTQYPPTHTPTPTLTHLVDLVSPIFLSLVTVRQRSSKLLGLPDPRGVVQVQHSYLGTGMEDGPRALDVVQTGGGVRGKEGERCAQYVQ